MSELKCIVKGVRSNLPDREAIFEFGEKPIWTVRGPVGPRPLSERACDLVDLVGAIYRAESQIRNRRTDPAILWTVNAPVRDPEFWQEEGGDLLASVLGFLNRASWEFTFSKRTAAPDVTMKFSDDTKIEEIVLFSGGLDSLCGAGSRTRKSKSCRLVSQYHRQGGLQIDLADRLGYAAPVQWRLAGRRGREGMNLLRSSMFLTLAAAVASTYGAKRIFQYENGILALAIPPSGNFIPTRHAHPETHRRMEILFDRVFEDNFSIHNPFLSLTKREAVKRLEKVLGMREAAALIQKTETCWYVSQPTVANKKKNNGQPCGVCTPCIVRATARPEEIANWKWSNSKVEGKGYACDLRKSYVRIDERLGMTFRAYLEFVDIVLQAASPSEMVDQFAPEARIVVDNVNEPKDGFVAKILRRFAHEFCDTFDIEQLLEPRQ